MAETVEVTFRYAIGQIVYSREAEHSLAKIPKPLIIVEQLAQRCSAGVQIQYKVFNDTAWIPECVLQDTPPPFQPRSEEYLAALAEETRARTSYPRWEPKPIVEE